MGKTSQEKQAELIAKTRLLSFDLGVESAVASFGLEKEAVAKAAGARDFKEFTEWTLNAASAMAAQAEQQNAKK
jgi:hypothetical protein